MARGGGAGAEGVPVRRLDGLALRRLHTAHRVPRDHLFTRAVPVKEVEGGAGVVLKGHGVVGRAGRAAEGRLLAVDKLGLRAVAVLDLDDADPVLEEQLLVEGVSWPQGAHAPDLPREGGQESAESGRQARSGCLGAVLSHVRDRHGHARRVEKVQIRRLNRRLWPDVRGGRRGGERAGGRGRGRLPARRGLAASRRTGGGGEQSHQAHLRPP
mmetsp:Transcript_15955/g.51579  ORF Transcript_15955/g.51579 Transcript_15955/m.51579 type:complete len:213 (+) Transcript_15955:351-989(+)